VATAAQDLKIPARPATLRQEYLAFGVMIAFFLVAPSFMYPIFLMKALCFGLFASAFNLLIGYVGLLSFGHAAFLGSAGYATAHAAKVWGLPPELAILFGTAVAGLLGLAIGALAIRRLGVRGGELVERTVVERRRHFDESRHATESLPMRWSRNPVAPRWLRFLAPSCVPVRSASSRVAPRSSDAATVPPKTSPQPVGSVS